MSNSLINNQLVHGSILVRILLQNKSNNVLLSEGVLVSDLYDKTADLFDVSLCDKRFCVALEFLEVHCLQLNHAFAEGGWISIYTDGWLIVDQRDG